MFRSVDLHQLAKAIAPAAGLMRRGQTMTAVDPQTRRDHPAAQRFMRDRAAVHLRQFLCRCVGPKSAYRSRTSDNARSRYASGRRLLLGRPRRFEIKLAAPPCFKPASKRNTWRRFKPSNSQASATRNRPDLYAQQHLEPVEFLLAHRHHQHRALPRPVEPREVSRQLCKGVPSLYCCYIKCPRKLQMSVVSPI
jgi:hypothetical protein